MSLGVLLAVGTADFEGRLLAAADSPGLHVARRCLDVADLLATAGSRQADVAVVAAALPGLDADIVARLRAESLLVVGVAADDQGADGEWLTGIGVDVVVPASELESLEAATRVRVNRGVRSAGGTGDAAASDGGPLPPEGDPGAVLAVWGPTGAPGRTTVALGVASELAAAGKEVLLLDADVYGGSVAQALGLLDEASGLLAAARAANTGRLTAETLAGLSRAVTPNLRVLTGLPRADRWTELRPALFRTVLDAARGLCDVAVVDCGFSIELDEEVSYDTAAPRRNGATVAALELADVVLLVGRADPIGLGRLVRAVSELSSLVPMAAVEVVVNRMRSSLGWSASDITAMLRRTTSAQSLTVLPDDQRAADRCIVLGKTLAECAADSKLRAAVRALSGQLAECLPARPAAELADR